MNGRRRQGDAAVPCYSALPGYRVQLARSPAEAAPYLAAWEALAGEAAEPNLFYAPWALLPALEQLAGKRRFVLVFLLCPADGATQSDERLDGVFPLYEPQGCRLAPLAVARMIRHRYCFSEAPLLRRGEELAVLRGFLGWLHGQRRRYPLLLLRDVPASGRLTEALREALREARRCSHEGRHWQRALAPLGGDGEAQLARTLPAKELRKYQRRYAQLAEQGTLRVRMLQPGDGDLAAWLARFLALEQQGWKGRMGTAIACRASAQRYFEALATAAHARGWLVMLELSLDGRPLAMLCDFLQPPGGFCFKSAFDEAWARYSPGLLLELEYIRRHAELRARGAEWLDSCTEPDSDWVARLWPERKPLCSVLISSGTPLADLWVGLYPWAKRLRRLLAWRRGG